MAAMASKSSSSNNRGRPYGMMLLLAFGAAVLGVMVLHKMRERRIFSILMKDKDRQLVALQLLLQKERHMTKEMKIKIEELKAKGAALRAQKVDLTNKLMEMRSMTASLKEEEKILQSVLAEKNKEIKTLTEKEMETKKEVSQVTAVTELLKQKEATINELKQHLENPTKIWSVSTDDPSNPNVNATAVENVSSKIEVAVNQSKEQSESSEDGQSINSMNSFTSEAMQKSGQRGERNEIEGNIEDDDSLVKRDEKSEKNVIEDEEKGGVSTEGQSEKFENTQDYGFKRRHGGEYRSAEREERGTSVNDGQADIVESSRYGEGLKMNYTRDDAEKVQVTEQGFSRVMQEEKLDVSKDDEGNEQGTVINDRKNLEIFDPSQSSASSSMSKQGHRSKSNGRRRRVNSQDGSLSKVKNIQGGVSLSARVDSSKDGVDAGLSNENGARKATEGSVMEDEKGTAFEDGRFDHKYVGSLDRKGEHVPDNSSEVNKWVEDSNKGEIEITKNSTNGEVGKRTETEENDDVGGNEQKTDSSNDQLQTPHNSEDERTLEGSKKEFSNDDLQIGKEMSIKIKLVDEPEAVSGDRQSEITQKPEDGETLKSEIDDENALNFESNRLISRYEQSKESPSSKGSETDLVEDDEHQMVSDDKLSEKSFNSQNGENTRSSSSGDFRRLDSYAYVQEADNVKQQQKVIDNTNVIKVVESETRASAVGDSISNLAVLPKHIKRKYRRKKMRSSGIEKMRLTTD